MVLISLTLGADWNIFNATVFAEKAQEDRAGPDLFHLDGLQALSDLLSDRRVPVMPPGY